MARSTPSTPTSTPRRPARPLLRDPRFLRLWTGTTATGLATWALPFVLGLAVLDRTLSPTGLGVVLAARTVGFLIAVPAGGVLADRHSRRGVAVFACLAAALATPLLAAELGGSSVVMMAAAAIVGAGQGACRPALQALTADVVAAPRRHQANAAISLAVRLTTLVAPGLAALLATIVDTRTLVVGTGVLWLVAALVTPAGSHGTVTDATREPFLTEFVSGIREARRHPWFVAGLTALTAVIATGYSATAVALPFVSRDRHGSEAVLATALTAYTAGALAGALLLARWRPPSPGWTALAGLACYGFAPLTLLLPTHPAWIFAAYAVAGLGIELFNVPWFTAAQREVEPRLLARVSSLDFLLSYGLAPLGLALIAPAIDTYGAPAVLATCALTCFLAPAAAALTPGTRHFSRPADG